MYKILLMVFSLFILSMGCQAPNETKAGGEGEYCNGNDADCRNGYICDVNVCRGLETLSEFSCSKICDHLETCSANQKNCEATCEATFKGRCQGLACPWSIEARDSFGKCIVESTCIDLKKGEDAFDSCYAQIPLVDARARRCSAFVAAANKKECGASSESIKNIASYCGLLARTATDTSWARTETCVDRIANGTCSQVLQCFDDVFLPKSATVDQTN